MRTLPLLLLMCCMAGCAVLPEPLRPAAWQRTDSALQAEVERLLDQPYIDPLTRFLQQHAAQHGDDPGYRRLARERDSRCRAIGTRYARQSPTEDNLQSLRNGYQFSCPEQVQDFARRVAERPAPAAEPSAADAPKPSARPQASTQANDCYLLFAIRNYQQAQPACTQAAEAGDARAQHHLASLLRSNRAFTDALYWAEQSSSGGYPPGQLLLAEFYQRGHGAPADRDRALQLIEQAAGQGLAEAQYQAGMAWLNGTGTEPDHAIAQRWLERAAAQDNVAAQLQLAELYFNHPGEEQQQARRWLQQAANLGSAPAQYRLGVSYLEGSGGPADPVEAYVWLSLALLNGEQRARAGVEQLAGQLSPAQLAAARQRINTSAAPGRPF